MIETVVFGQALGLDEHWQVDRMAFDVGRGRLDLHVAWRAPRATCPGCGAPEQEIQSERGRSWRHLNFFQYETHLHCQVPRVACTHCSKTTRLPVPWERADSGFGAMFEALVLRAAALRRYGTGAAKTLISLAI